MSRSTCLSVALGLTLAGSAHAQEPPPQTAPSNPATICGQPIPAPQRLPPDGSAPVLYLIAPCFEAQGGSSLIDIQTYLYYIQLRGSRPSENVWIPWDAKAEQTALDDFHRLWGTNFLDNLWIETKDYRFENGVIGKLVTYNMEERQRVKIVDYVGSKKIETSKIDDKLKEANAQIRLDTFIDKGLVRKVQGIVLDMMREKGFQFASVTPQIQEVVGSPKLVHLTFQIDEGPKVKIQTITFVGNKAISSSTLKRHMKENKEMWWLSAISGRGTYQEGKFDDDAEKLVEFYRDNGYIRAQVGVPELKYLDDSSDKKTRYIDLRIPITEGRRYKVGEMSIAGNTVIKTEFLKPLFKLQPGEFYSDKAIRKGFEKAREIYGTGGYFEFTGYPDLKPRDELVGQVEAPEMIRVDPPMAGPGAVPPVVDVTVRMQEGKQYFVNRITFSGNNTTRDNVIRREVRLVEEGVFNTEALKYTIKRLNQLGYFKPLEGGKDVNVDKTPGVDNKVDVKLKLEEQNRNQLTFGAGVSQYEGFFGQLSFTTSNFMGRGESLTLSLQAGSRAQNYTLGFTEPFLFDRNITAGFQIFRSTLRYVSEFTQNSRGFTTTFGFPVADFTRFFLNYSFQQVSVTDINTDVLTPQVLAANPYLQDALLVGQNGTRTISKVVPSIVRNTVDNPIFPTSGTRLTAAIDLAGLGGDTNFYKPLLEGVYFWRQNSRLTLGMRGQYAYIHQFTQSKTLPITELLFLGGEYSVRGFDIRTIGPQDPITHLVIGGNKSLLFNLEEMISIAGPVRLIFFYDAGEVEPGPTIALPPAFVPYPSTNLGATVVPGSNFNWMDFKTSTGAEVRFMMPVLNVPFRLIFALNPRRAGVYDNTLQPQSFFQFRFAVGSTF